MIVIVQPTDDEVREYVAIRRSSQEDQDTYLNRVMNSSPLSPIQVDASLLGSTRIPVGNIVLDRPAIVRIQSSAVYDEEPPQFDDSFGVLGIVFS